MANATSQSHQLSEAVIKPVPERVLSPVQKPIAEQEIPVTNEMYRVAILRLQLSAVPTSLPCRQKEKSMIVEFLKHGISHRGSSSSLYISGMPGTGKTATTLEVIRNLKAVFNFEFLHINGMALTNPNLVYTIIFEHITGRRVCP